MRKVLLGLLITLLIPISSFAWELDKFYPNLEFLAHFNEGAGVTSKNEYNNDLSALAGTGNAWVTGRFGNGAYFNGSGCWNFPNYTTVNALTEFTAGCWFNTTFAGGSIAETFFEKARLIEAGCTWGLSNGATAVGGSPPHVSVIIYNASGWHACVGTTHLNDGVDHWVSFTYSAGTSGGTAKIYVDGNLENTITSVGALTYDGAPVRMGSLYDAGYYASQGTVDEAFILDRVLNPTEMKTMYYQQLEERSGSISSKYPGLISLWHFDEGTGTTVADAVGSNTLNVDGAWVTGNHGNMLTCGTGSSFGGTSIKTASEMGLNGNPAGMTIVSEITYTEYPTTSQYDQILSFYWGTNEGGMKSYGQGIFNGSYSGATMGDWGTWIAGGAWYHSDRAAPLSRCIYITTYNGSTGVTNLYSNGVLDGSWTAAVNLSDTYFYLNSFPGVGNKTKTFYIDELAILNRCITQEEVTSLTNQLNRTGFNRVRSTGKVMKTGKTTHN